jgi:ferric-dicitrate binding protein FerR (iron transport regulator)
MNDQINYRALIYQYFHGTISHEDKEHLFEWISESNQNKEQFDAYKELYELTNEMYSFNEPNVHSSWNSFREKLNIEGKTTCIRPLHKRPVFNIVMKIAAMIILVFGIGLLFLHKNQEKKLIVSTTDEKKMVVLPDSSKIWINNNTKLLYKGNFEQARELELIGEAYFVVNKTDDLSSFIVYTPAGKVKVLGTSFLIKAYTGETEVVYVNSGKVLYTSQHKKSGVILRPGDQGTSKKGAPAEKTKINDQNYLAWKTDTLVFDNQLKYIVDVLEDYFDIHIDVENPELLTYNFTGKFINPELQDVFSVLSAAMNLRIKNADINHYIITGEGKHIKQ